MSGFKMGKIEIVLRVEDARTSSILFPFGTPPLFGNILHSPCRVYRGSGFFKYQATKEVNYVGY